MSRSKSWVGEAVLHAPDSVRALRNVPVVGKLIHRLSHRILDPHERVWSRVDSGPAEGLWLELNPRTGQAYARGDAEPAVQHALAAHLRAGEVFYDIGANLGFYTLLAARAVGAQGKVFSFEPDAENARRLEKNIVRNRFENVAVIEAGVWCSSGKREFSASGPASPDRGVGTFVHSASAATATAAATGVARAVVCSESPAGRPLIPCVSLDEFARSATPPAGIKVDVEGAEIEVLLGARETLLRHRPWVLCETQSPEHGRAARKILSALGYSLKAIDDIHLFATA